MTLGQVTDLHEAAKYKSIASSGPDVSGAGTFKVCPVYVPYDHIVRRAKFASFDQTNTGTDNMTLKQKLIGSGIVATAGPVVLWGDTALVATEIDLAPNGDQDTPVGPAIYYVEVVSDAGDVILNPALTLMISPVPPGP